MSHVSSLDSLNGRRTSSDSGKDPEGTGTLGVPSDSAGPRVSPERRGSGPGPVVARRKSSDTAKEPRVGSWQERRSCSSLSEKETAESPVTNGCIDRWSSGNKQCRTGKQQFVDRCESLTVSVFVSPLRSVGEEGQNGDKCIQSNGVEDPQPGEGAYSAVCAGPVNGSADAEC